MSVTVSPDANDSDSSDNARLRRQVDILDQQIDKAQKMLARIETKQPGNTTTKVPDRDRSSTVES